MSKRVCLYCGGEIVEEQETTRVRSSRGPDRYAHVERDDCSRALSREQYWPGGRDPEGSMRGLDIRRRR